MSTQQYCRIQKMISDYHRAFDDGDLARAKKIKSSLLVKHGLHVAPSEPKPLNRLKVSQIKQLIEVILL